MSHRSRKQTRRRIHFRIRKKIAGTPDRPRLAVCFSNKHVYAQLIDDEAGRTLATASTLEKSVPEAHVNVESAATIGKLIAERGKGAEISRVVFDRGGFLYHGKVKALADAAREGGLEF